MIDCRKKTGIEAVRELFSKPRKSSTAPVEWAPVEHGAAPMLTLFQALKGKLTNPLPTHEIRDRVAAAFVLSGTPYKRMEVRHLEDKPEGVGASLVVRTDNIHVRVDFTHSRGDVCGFEIIERGKDTTEEFPVKIDAPPVHPMVKSKVDFGPAFEPDHIPSAEEAVMKIMTGEIAKDVEKAFLTKSGDLIDKEALRTAAIDYREKHPGLKHDVGITKGLRGLDETEKKIKGSDHG